MRPSFAGPLTAWEGAQAGAEDAAVEAGSGGGGVLRSPRRLVLTARALLERRTDSYEVWQSRNRMMLLPLRGAPRADCAIGMRSRAISCFPFEYPVQIMPACWLEMIGPALLEPGCFCQNRNVLKSHVSEGSEDDSRQLPSHAMLTTINSGSAQPAWYSRRAVPSVAGGAAAPAGRHRGAGAARPAAAVAGRRVGRRRPARAVCHARPRCTRRGAAGHRPGKHQSLCMAQRRRCYPRSICIWEFFCCLMSSSVAVGV